MADDKIIQYSERYYDDTYEYRHVILPRKIVRTHPITRLLGEDEWRALGVCQSLGWVHYAIHIPEPEVMLFRRLRQDWNPSVKQQQKQSQAPQDGQEKEKKSDPQG